MVYIFITKNPYMHLTKPKTKERCFYCCSSYQSHNEAFNMQQMLTTHCKFKTAPSTGLNGIFTTCM